jgi:hypothetical protein
LRLIPKIFFAKAKVAQHLLQELNQLGAVGQTVEQCGLDAGESGLGFRLHHPLAHSAQQRLDGRMGVRTELVYNLEEPFEGGNVRAELLEKNN